MATGPGIYLGLTVQQKKYGPIGSNTINGINLTASDAHFDN